MKWVKRLVLTAAVVIGVLFLLGASLGIECRGKLHKPASDGSQLLTLRCSNY